MPFVYDEEWEMESDRERLKLYLCVFRVPCCWTILKTELNSFCLYTYLVAATVVMVEGIHCFYSVHFSSFLKTNKHRPNTKYARTCTILKIKEKDGKPRQISIRSVRSFCSEYKINEYKKKRGRRIGISFSFL